MSRASALVILLVLLSLISSAFAQTSASGSVTISGSLQGPICVNGTCGCHIGYVHLDRLKLYDTFGSGVLERIPLGYR